MLGPLVRVVVTGEMPVPLTRVGPVVISLPFCKQRKNLTHYCTPLSRDGDHIQLVGGTAN